MQSTISNTHHLPNRQTNIPFPHWQHQQATWKQRQQHSNHLCLERAVDTDNKWVVSKSQNISFSKHLINLHITEWEGWLTEWVNEGVSSSACVRLSVIAISFVWCLSDNSVFSWFRELRVREWLSVNEWETVTHQPVFFLSCFACSLSSSQTASLVSCAWPNEQHCRIAQRQVNSGINNTSKPCMYPSIGQSDHLSINPSIHTSIHPSDHLSIILYIVDLTSDFLGICVDCQCPLWQ